MTTLLETTTVRDAAAAAVDVVKTYGRGDAAVRALDGVIVGRSTRPVHRHHGPLGLGQVHADALLAGLDSVDQRHRASSATTDLSTLTERELTLLRRDRIGFVFQAFNLVPTLTAAREHHAPAGARRPAARPGVDRRARRHRRPGRPADATGPRSCPAASSSGSPSPGPWRPAGDRLRRRAHRQPRLPRQRGGCSSSCAAPSTTSARRSSWSPTTRSPRPTPTGSSFLADGRVVDELDSPTAPAILARMTDLTATLTSPLDTPKGR